MKMLFLVQSLYWFLDISREAVSITIFGRSQFLQKKDRQEEPLRYQEKSREDGVSAVHRTE